MQEDIGAALEIISLFKLETRYLTHFFLSPSRSICKTQAVGQLSTFLSGVQTKIAQPQYCVHARNPLLQAEALTHAHTCLGCALGHARTTSTVD